MGKLSTHFLHHPSKREAYYSCFSPAWASNCLCELWCCPYIIKAVIQTHTSKHYKLHSLGGSQDFSGSQSSTLWTFFFCQWNKLWGLRLKHPWDGGGEVLPVLTGHTAVMPDPVQVVGWAALILINVHVGLVGHKTEHEGTYAMWTEA